jgi:hypothetical protein
MSSSIYVLSPEQAVVPPATPPSNVKKGEELPEIIGVSEAISDALSEGLRSQSGGGHDNPYTD